MKFNYTINRKDLKKLYIKEHQKINSIYIILITILFFIFTYDMLRYNVLVFMAIYLIILILLTIIFHLFNLLYSSILVKRNEKKNNCYGNFSVEMNEYGIININEKMVIKIKWKNIDDIKIEKKMISIKYHDNKDNLLLLINYDFLNNKSDFENIKKFLNEKLK